MPDRFIAVGLLVFGLFTAALIINLTALQPPGTRQLAPAPVAQAVAKAPARNAASAEDVERKKFILLNAEKNNQTAAEVQRELKALGYMPGQIDGSVDLATRAAVMAFEYDNGLPLTGKVDATQLRRLLLGLGEQSTPLQKNAGLPASEEAKNVMRTVQRSLNQLNFRPGRIDGLYSAETESAIRSFERKNKLPETGRVSGRLIAGMSKLADYGSLQLSRR